MNPFHRPPTFLTGLAYLGVSSLMVCSLGCSEVQARRHARQGNTYFKDGDYSAALAEYSLAEQFRPDLPVVVLNKGLACRQLMIAGGKTVGNARATDCALNAFSHLKDLEPGNPRGDQLYVQTLFDADRYDALGELYQKKLQSQPGDLASINGLIQVYSRALKWPQALHWTCLKADLLSRDPESQYAVGVFIHNLLFQKGGNGDRAAFDPRPSPNRADPPKLLPSFDPMDITGNQRLELADRGISYLEKAIRLRPNYGDAMVYLGLLYRQRALALWDRPADWQSCIESAESWRHKAIQAIPVAKGPAPKP